jgi:hypothetical protein
MRVKRAHIGRVSHGESRRSSERDHVDSAPGCLIRGTLKKNGKQTPQGSVLFSVGVDTPRMAARFCVHGRPSSRARGLDVSAPISRGSLFTTTYPDKEQDHE